MTEVDDSFEKCASCYQYWLVRERARLQRDKVSVLPQSLDFYAELCFICLVNNWAMSTERVPCDGG